MPSPRTLVLFFTTFPVATETFLQREVKALAAEGVSLELWSCWKGESTFEGIPVRRPSFPGWISLIGWLPYWVVRSPRGVWEVLRAFLRRPPPNRVNFGENLLGLALGVRLAHRFAARSDDYVLHAVWASLPATVAAVIAQLVGRSFTFAAHAYDLFEDGGDWILPEKCVWADWIRTSTEAGKRRLAEAGASEGKIIVIRRGLLEMPPHRQPAARDPQSPLRIISVGRFVEKMGHSLPVQVYAALAEAGIPFEAELIGDGPEREAVASAVAREGLTNRVQLRGPQPFGAVQEALARVDVALFTGVVARSGDRAGFPNFVGEAMAAGVPVVTTPVGAIEEVVLDGENGLVAADWQALVAAVEAVWHDPEAARERAENARAWAERHFDARSNMRRFRAALGV